MVVEMVALGTITIVTLLDIYMLKRLLCSKREKKDSKEAENVEKYKYGIGSYLL
jgi:hypothetical protein